MILDDLLDEIRKAKFYGIMADEVTLHKIEQLSLCIRFVDAVSNIREEFIEFLHMPSVTGEATAKAILDSLKRKGLDVQNIRAQTYDGAAAMSSDNVEVQKRIRDEAVLAVYSHCTGHCLNLVIVNSCKLGVVRNTLQQMKETCLFFNYSPKREGLLKSVIDYHVSDSGKKKPLLNLCVTRWAERHTAYSHFYSAYIHMVYALEVIAHGLHHRDGSDLANGKWSTKTKQEASGILGALTSFDFIISFITVYVMLSHLDGVSVKLQSANNDIYQAYTLINKVIQIYEDVRLNIDEHFNKCYIQAMCLADKLGVTPEAPRIARRQMHRSNISATSPNEYYKLNLATPFIDHIQAELKEQFTGLSAVCGRLIGLVPNILLSQNSTPTLMMLSQCTVQICLLLNFFYHELYRWRMHFSLKDGSVPNSIVSALKECDPVFFPNIHVLLRIAAPIPVTSCECERSFSALRRLNTYNRSCMGQERLSSLALLHIHYDNSFDLDEVVNKFAVLHPRRMDLQNIISACMRQ